MLRVRGSDAQEEETVTTPDTWIVVVIVGLIIAGTAQVLINSIVLKRFRIQADWLKAHNEHMSRLDLEVFGDMTVISGPDIEETK